jgi:diadenosine tetraphosphate (Ap4A) HIT family hydrolase
LTNPWNRFPYWNSATPADHPKGKKTPYTMLEIANRRPFCSLPSSRIICEDSLSLVIRDAYPISKGHSLIIPKRHVASLFDLTDDERTRLFQHLSKAKTALGAEFKPDAYNIGINEGAAAGQTVFHLHVHLIPRYHGDKDDPRGGVRWIFPDKASYWI